MGMLLRSLPYGGWGDQTGADVAGLAGTTGLAKRPIRGSVESPRRLETEVTWMTSETEMFLEIINVGTLCLPVALVLFAVMEGAIRLWIFLTRKGKQPWRRPFGLSSESKIPSYSVMSPIGDGKT
jgi:hypothetical protein